MMIFTNMRLQEDINRIKQVMGINESAISSFKRRINRLPIYIKGTEGYRAKMFRNFEEYLNSVIFRIKSDFLSGELGITYKDESEDRYKIEEMIEDFVLENYLDEIRNTYERKIKENTNNKAATINEEYEEPTHAVIEVLHGVPYMTDKYRYQVVPYPATKEDEVNIKKGPSKDEAVSKKYIKVLKTGNKNDMKDHISKLKEKSSAEWIKCKNCRKKFTQTIHKGKKSLPICPTCGTHN